MLVGDSDVGKAEILSGLEEGSVESPYSPGELRHLLYKIACFISFQWLLMFDVFSKGLFWWI